MYRFSRGSVRSRADAGSRRETRGETRSYSKDSANDNIMAVIIIIMIMIITTIIILIIIIIIILIIIIIIIILLLLLIIISSSIARTRPTPRRQRWA